jgi:hypothetical protein
MMLLILVFFSISSANARDPLPCGPTDSFRPANACKFEPISLR